MISTDGQPVSLQYVEHVDSLWVLCRRSEEEAKAGRQSIMVIKSAGQPGPHHTIHTEPVGHTFELVEGLFIPREQIPKQVGFYNLKKKKNIDENLSTITIIYLNNGDSVSC